ncbi:MAG: asparagine synthetase B, partial [Bacteroidetes bacterium B1(2017)]
PFAKNIANYLATDHSEYYCNKEDVRQMTEMMPYHYDEPFGDSSCIPTMLISKFAVKDVKVALSADAGDEVFSGYNYHSGIVELNKYIEQSPKILNSLIANIMEWIKAEKIPFLNSTYNFKTRFERLQLLLKDSNYLNYLKTYNLQFTDKDLKKLLKTDLPASKITLFDSELTQECKDLLSQVLATDYSTFLVDDVLVKVDRATMSFGLEGREPLLDHRLIEWVSRLPNELKIKKIKDKKYLLKKITN